MDAARDWHPYNWALPDSALRYAIFAKMTARRTFPPPAPLLTRAGLAVMRFNGVADAAGGTDESLEYPFRDDGKLVFDAIASYMVEAVDAVYDKSDAAVAADKELQAYAAELSTIGHPGKCVRVRAMQRRLH